MKWQCKAIISRRPAIDSGDVLEGKQQNRKDKALFTILPYQNSTRGKCRWMGAHSNERDSKHKFLTWLVCRVVKNLQGTHWLTRSLRLLLCRYSYYAGKVANLAL